MIASVKTSERLLCVSHGLLWGTISISCIRDEVGSVGRTSMREVGRVRNYLQVFVFRANVFMLNHHFTNGRLLGKVKLIDC